MSTPDEGNERSSERVDAPDQVRNPRAERKGRDMPEDYGSGHRTDPESDYPRPDGKDPHTPGAGSS